jgi:hypothetical protein
MARFSLKISQIRAQWDRLTTRERRMISTLAGVFLAFIAVLFGYFGWSGLADLEDHNESARKALRDIAEHREEFLDARRHMDQQEVRVSRTPVQLSTVLEAAAKECDLKLDETNDRQPAPRGKKYIEKGVDVKIHRVDLQSLAKFLHRIETGPTLVVVDRLLIRTRYNEHDQLQVEIGVLTWEHAPETPRPAQGAGKADKS